MDVYLASLSEQALRSSNLHTSKRNDLATCTFGNCKKEKKAIENFLRQEISINNILKILDMGNVEPH